MEAITSPAFGIDMDPSHIYRAGENPVEAIAAVISRVKHVHIRDCKGRQQNPGKPEMQANGRGDIDLVGYIRVLHENGYTGPLDLEIIGAKDVHAGAVLRHRRRSRAGTCRRACRRAGRGKTNGRRRRTDEGGIRSLVCFRHWSSYPCFGPVYTTSHRMRSGDSNITW